MKLLISLISILFIGAACAHKKEMKVNTSETTPGTTVNWGGKPLKLHQGKIAIGDDLNALAQKTDVKFPFNNKVTVISIVPSIDTVVCEEQTHILGETKKLKPGIDRIVLSRDLPMAQKRFAKEAKLENLSYVSDYKTASFGKTTGLLVEKSALLARGVIVVDEKGKVSYMQIVSELSELPDMDKAFEFANKLSTKN